MRIDWPEKGNLVELRDGVSVPDSLTMTVDPENGGPLLTVVVEIQEGVPTCREIRLTRQGDGEEVSTRHLRMVSVDAQVAFAVSQFGFEVEIGDDVTSISPLWDASSIRMIRNEVGRRRARRTMTPDFLREVAAVYRDNVETAPTAAVADQWGVEHRTAARWVRAARDEGELGEAPGRGMAGELEPKPTAKKGGRRGQHQA